MSVPSSSVEVQVRLDQIAGVAQAVESAIAEAIARTVERLRQYAMGGSSQVPVRTGRLKASFDIGSTPRSIVFRWSAIDPKTNYDYAKIQDQGGPNRYGYIAGKYFSETAKMYARQWFSEELTAALEAMRP